MNDTRADVRNGILDAAQIGIFTYIGVEIIVAVGPFILITLLILLGLVIMFIADYWPYCIAAVVIGVGLYFFFRELRVAFRQARQSRLPNPPASTVSSWEAPEPPAPPIIREVQPYFAED